MSSLAVPLDPISTNWMECDDLEVSLRRSRLTPNNDFEVIILHSIGRNVVIEMIGSRQGVQHCVSTFSCNATTAQPLNESAGVGLVRTNMENHNSRVYAEAKPRAQFLQGRCSGYRKHALVDLVVPSPTWGNRAKGHWHDTGSKSGWVFMMQQI